MKKFLYLILIFLISSCSKIDKIEQSDKPLVAVSIPSYLFFIKKIAGNTVEVTNLIPAEADPHHFEPTPKQLNVAIKAQIWFRSQESFENTFFNLIKPYNPNLQVCDLTQDMPLIGNDLHLWLSPKIAILQAQKISAFLEEKFPQNKALYQDNLKKLIQEIQTVDQEIQAKLEKTTHKTILASHSAFSYFCQNYGLKQLSVEDENHKEPTLKSLYQLLNEAKKEKVKKVFIQAQVDNKGAFLIAKELQLTPIMVDPYSEDYLENLKKIADFIVQEPQ